MESNTIFTHAGIDHELGENWMYTDDYTFTNKYPQYIGKVDRLKYKVVAGHILTSDIVDDSSFNDIYYDGYNHYYLDGNVVKTGILNIMLVVTGEDEDKYYKVTENGKYLIKKFEN